MLSVINLTRSQRDNMCARHPYRYHFIHMHEHVHSFMYFITAYAASPREGRTSQPPLCMMSLIGRGVAGTPRVQTTRTRAAKKIFRIVSEPASGCSSRRKTSKQCS